MNLKKIVTTAVLLLVLGSTQAGAFGQDGAIYREEKFTNASVVNNGGWTSAYAGIMPNYNYAFSVTKTGGPSVGYLEVSLSPVNGDSAQIKGSSYSSWKQTSTLYSKDQKFYSYHQANSRSRQYTISGVSIRRS